MRMDEIRARRSAITELGKRYGADRIRVFGSVARGEERPDSDIDFLVALKPGYDMFRQRLPFAEELGELLHHPVDVVPEHELNPHLRDRVLREAVEL
ncbi:MAG: nucleotidyltransferase family protein [Thiohalospira sp.]